MTLRRSVRRAAGLLALALSVFATPTATGAQRQSTELGWSGTVVVERKASGRISGSGPGSTYLGFDGLQTVTYRLKGDGTAIWDSTYTGTIDGGGLYTIPSRGSGGGSGWGGAGFADGEWLIVATTDDQLDITTDHSAEDAKWFEVFKGLIDLGAAMSGQTAPSSAGARIESGQIGVPGAQVPWKGAANATTLVGSASETIPGSEDMGGIPGVPETFTVRWNLTRGPVAPHVTINGPACGCLTGDDTEKTLRFNAGAAPMGGEFSEFVVTLTGKMPEIVTNEGGDRPFLELTGTKDTGEVTLKITYTRSGVKTTSAPFTVNFCAIEKIELADDEHDIAFDNLDRLRVDAKAKAWRGGKEISKELEWQLEEMGAPTSLEAQPSSKKNDQIRFEYHDLPAKNSDFGRKKLTARVGGTCACQRDEYIRTFFNPEDTNNPDGVTPNWFYYWKQTGAVPSGAQGWLRFQAMVSDPYQPGQAIAVYDHATQKILLSKLVFGANACRGEVVPDTRAPTGRQAEGIDCFGETVKHEIQHRTDAADWWGSPAGHYGVAFPTWFMEDWDHDLVPNRVETLLTGCKPGTALDVSLDALKLFTLPEREEAIARGKGTWFTCARRPFDDVTDSEINAYWEGWKWPLKSADKEDWSCGPLAKQWKGKKCGQ